MEEASVTSRKRKGGKGPQQPPRVRGSGVPDEVRELPFGYVARFGRFITTGSTLSQEEHSRAIDALLAGEDEERRKQATLRQQLLAILTKMDPFDLLARASLTYLHMDPDTFKEWESDRSPAHVEYLALHALGADGPEAGERRERSRPCPSEGDDLIQPHAFLLWRCSCHSLESPRGGCRAGSGCTRETELSRSGEGSGRRCKAGFARFPDRSADPLDGASNRCRSAASAVCVAAVHSEHAARAIQDG